MKAVLCFWSAVATVLWFVAPACCDPAEPPLVGQPDTFLLTGAAVGSGFRVSQSVTPSRVQVEEVVTLTVRISAASVQRVPQQPRLWDLKPYQDLERKKLLHIGRPDPKHYEPSDPKARSWEFHYRLRPLSTSLTRLPALAFPYYKPSASPDLPGVYETVSTAGVPITVTLKTERALIPAPPIQVPPAILHIVEGPDVRASRNHPVALPALPLLVLLVLLPPFVSIAWSLLWKRWNPDAVRRARLRQSRAAKHALHALRALPPTNDAERAERVAAIAAVYLQHRLGLPTVEPTPAEVSAYLERVGAPGALAGKTAEFFRACDTARFAPIPERSTDDLSATAGRLIQTLESEPWSASP